jgi:hypothetical protein
MVGCWHSSTLQSEGDRHGRLDLQLDDMNRYIATRCPRFSLRSLVAVVTLVAMVLVIWRLYAELVPLREENRRLRSELGELSIDDETKFHAILMPQANPNEFTYKWRIWVPEGRSYQLQFASGTIRKQGFPQGYSNGISISAPGEHWIEYRVFRDADSGRWIDMLYTRDASVSGSYQPWPDWSERVGTGASVGDSTRVFEPGSRVELVRWRISQAKSSAQIEDPSAGYMIWLEPVR